jgi:uncharacterized membrane protein YbhN (UPF0104 family)
VTRLRAGRGGASVVVVVLRAGLSIALLLALAWWLDVAQIVARLGQMRAGWVFAALALSVIQVLVSAWRWRFTAGRLGIVLPFGQAVREYYLSMFVNQVLPGGVVGDVSRAWRHAAAQRLTTSSGGPAIRAVVLERLSGQLVMVGVASASVLTLVVGSGDAAWVVVLAGLGLVVAVRQWVKAPARDDGGDDAPSSRLSRLRLWHDTKTALLTGTALPIQVASSAVVVGTYVAIYLMASLAVDVDTPLRTLLPLVAPVLVAMLIPASVAGWGVRETAAALLWDAAGLTSEDGVVISIAYGLLSLVSSLPGCVVLLKRPRQTDR